MRIIIFVFISFTILGAHAKEIQCNGQLYNSGIIAKLKQSLLTKDLSLLNEVSVYPLKVQLLSSESFYEKNILEMVWDKVIDERIEKLLMPSNSCDVVRFLGLNKNHQITQVIFNFDKEDLKYAHAGITSAKAFERLIKATIKKLETGNTDSIGDDLKYPFLINTKSGDIVINSKSDYLKHKDAVLDEEFRTLVCGAVNESSLHFHYTGIMLNETGDMWVQEYAGGHMKFVILNSKTTP